GTFSYFASDIAYHVTKFERGFDKVVNIWGPDYQTYVARTKAALQALGYDPGRLEIFMYQIVRLFSAGEFVRVSKYEGELATLDELLDEVGLDAARFFYLIYSPSVPLDFDLDLVKEQSQKNPVYYVQYAHARASSLLHEATMRGVHLPEQLDWSLLRTDVERELLYRIAELPEEVAAAAARCEPHRLTHYAMELATAFHAFYTACRVLSDDVALSHARLALTQAAQITLRNALNLLGISAPRFEV
ncbi:MAG: DALR anticodon-binding domain-containing protein, partial [Abditibacteriales bacterium]|nr:DALR anticodon-binding domain-containing protein [Abditibacteriales bacterium]